MAKYTLRSKHVIPALTKEQRDRWYSLGEGTVRDQVGMKSTRLKDGRIRAEFFVKASAREGLTDAEALALVVRAAAVVLA